MQLLHSLGVSEYGHLALNASLTNISMWKGEINNNTIIVGDFNTLLTPMDRSTKQKISKETQVLNDTVDLLLLLLSCFSRV